MLAMRKLKFEHVRRNDIAPIHWLRTERPAFPHNFTQYMFARAVFSILRLPDS